MINPLAFQTCIAGLVGFRPSLDASYPDISQDLQESESGIYVNDIHSLVSVENIYNCINETGLIQLPAAWDNATAYKKFAKVSVNDIVYQALQDNTGHAITDPAYWKILGNPLSVYLQDKINQSAVKIANAVYINKNLNQQAKSIMPETMLYAGNGNIKNTIPGQGRFVGFRIKLKDLDLGAVIRKVGLQFNGQVTDFPIYLYNSSQDTYVKKWLVSTNSAFSFQWADVSQPADKTTLTFLSDSHNVGSDYYLGYYESDLNGLMAINNEYTFTKNLCGPCNPVNYALRQTWGSQIDIVPFAVSADQLPGDLRLWNTAGVGFTDGTNFGLNLLATVFCDTTDFFCRNRHGLANAVAFQTAVSVIQDMAYSARDNQQSQKLMNMATYALGNQQNNTPGLESQMAKQIMQVDFNYAGTNAKCLPCSDLYNNSVSLGSVY